MSVGLSYLLYPLPASPPLINRVPSPAVDLKEEKEPQKPEEATKLQNGDGSKESASTAVTPAISAATAAAAVVAAAASEEKKKAKTRFMFNIADGGFTGTHKHT